MVAWALFVWSTRINNAWSDHTASLASKWGATLLSVSFIGFAIAGTVEWVRARGRPWTRTEVLVLRAFAVWTTGVWLVFATLILVHHHPIAFKAVHVTLGLISIGLSVALWRTTEVDPPSSPPRLGRLPPPWDSPSPSSRSRRPPRGWCASRSTAASPAWASSATRHPSR